MPLFRTSDYSEIRLISFEELTHYYDWEVLQFVFTETKSYEYIPGYTNTSGESRPGYSSPYATRHNSVIIGKPKDSRYDEFEHLSKTAHTLSETNHSLNVVVRRLTELVKDGVISLKKENAYLKCDLAKYVPKT